MVSVCSITSTASTLRKFPTVVSINTQRHKCLTANGGTRIRAGEDVQVSERTPAPKDVIEEAEEDPVWVKREKLRKLQEEDGVDLPFGFYLIGSGVVAIAAVGSVFEFMNKAPVFGVIQPESPVWLPLLGFFVLAGFPVSGYLFFKSVESANKEAERQDEIDGQR